MTEPTPDSPIYDPAATDQLSTVQFADGGEVLLDAQGIGVRASWGHIYGPVDLRVRRGGLTVLVGAGGRGRTALLLTLAGRMKPTSGTLDSFGRINDARNLFANSALGFIEEVDGIEQTIRVHDVLTEQLRWTAPWYKIVGQSTQDDLERMCRPVFGPLTLPSLDAYVEELPELTAALFRIAMANIRRPELLVVGGVDKLSGDRSSRILLDRLIALGREQTVITADINGVQPQPGITDVIDVPNLTDDEFIRLQREDQIQ
ncbi:ATP-binding cassette domain-containing protein [Gordonia sp. (in: high G+C Gram-positive bacteria)]|uniref:ATP-binding cassette domain-containing protein n=1 Tax=Gordonia sp. (in: high G+C Gram-positive bacteria) TaxID=84139 RepID=UPI003C73C6FF